MLKYHADTRAQLGQVGPRIADRNPVDENVARRNCEFWKGRMLEFEAGRLAWKFLEGKATYLAGEE